jgi:uncharacterized membrane protein YphA (DoxX/SURF4 family)
MTIGKLVLFIAIAAVILTMITGFVLKKQKNLLISFLQHFTGALFIFSGWVKAVDPLGTAYKLEQYFAEFESTFADTWFGFLAPLFPALSEYAISFSVFMIVLEIVLGIMLIIGSRPKLAAWLFFLIVVFFTFLTGFTYLTGYVPDGVNFFEFGKWGKYTASNMKVTDCGCFGDFIKLEPKTSFFKDIFLLVPATIFLFTTKQFHQLFSPAVRGVVVGVSTLGLILYCMANYVWNIPHVDFRPFQAGKDIAAARAEEDEAAANVEIIGWQMVNEESGEIVDVNNPDYMEVVKDYPKDAGWKVKDQIKTEPVIPKTKISDFEISDAEGSSITEEILSATEPHIMIVSHELPFKGTYEGTVIYKDTLFAYDTIVTAETKDTQVVQRIEDIQTREEKVEKNKWKEGLVKSYKEVINPFLQDAREAGLKVYMVTAYMDPSQLEDFKTTVDGFYPIYQADDILLKTIVRSNPGIVLWQNGKILQKWHYKKLPSFEKAIKLAE